MISSDREKKIGTNEQKRASDWSISRGNWVISGVLFFVYVSWTTWGGWAAGVMCLPTAEREWQTKKSTENTCHSQTQKSVVNQMV